MGLFSRKETYTDEERDQLLSLPVCLFCGARHSHECKRVEEVSYSDTGKVTHAKFFRKWDQSDTIWDHDLEEVPILTLRVRTGHRVSKVYQLVKSRVLDAFWTVSYKAWLARAVTFAFLT